MVSSLYIRDISSSLDVAEITTPETITTLNAGSVGTVKITYDEPQTTEDITNVVGSIELYE